MEQEREEQRRTYLLCRLGFAILSVALVLACISWALSMAGPFVGWVRRSAFLHWFGTPIVWGSLVGTYLLWGRWNHRSWQRRSGLLLLMSLVDLILWFLEHGNDLSLRLGDVGHEWFRSHLGQALGWAEFALITSLACDFLVHLGIDQAREAGKATRSLAATGAVIWMLLFSMLTNWRGWPLAPRGAMTPEMFLLGLGTEVIWMITLLQVTALTIAAWRQSTRALLEMDRDDQEYDLLQFRS
ncbi:MAG: hypothetical protein WKF75_11865 [Singulisphaera sp.]